MLKEPFAETEVWLMVDPWPYAWDWSSWQQHCHVCCLYYYNCFRFLFK